MILTTIPWKRHSFQPLSRGILAIVMLVTAAFFGPLAHAADTVYNTTPEGVAIGGYDPVAYVVDGGPRPGDASFPLHWSGAEWRFASESNRALFENDPERYAPVYGGWCAMGMAGGDVVEVDFVDGWSLISGRVYLNVDAGIKKRWQRAASRFIRMADEEWPLVQPEILADRVSIYRKSLFPELYQ